MGVKSLICLPEGAPISKVEATKRLGAEVCLVPGVYDDAYQKALELKDEHGYTFVHPFDDENVIAGQGTIGLEILDQLPEVEAVVVPVGKKCIAAAVTHTVSNAVPIFRFIHNWVLRPQHTVKNKSKKINAEKQLPTL